jgi:hypothetical protein
MRALTDVTAGPLLAISLAPEIATETDPMRIAKPLSSTDMMVRDLPDLPQRSTLLDSWKQSDRRTKGHLSFKAYERASLSCPTDVWSYQRLFIDQRRDPKNLMANTAREVAPVTD